MTKSRKLNLIYKKLYKSFGPQHWWPGKTPFEVMVGAILTQNTNWQNVARAIANIKKSGAMDVRKLYYMPQKKLAKLLRPAGYFNIKAKRLKNFLKFYLDNYDANVRRMRAVGTEALRDQLLSVNGVGQETADSILLYALKKPVFVVDAYTKRFCLRHGFTFEDSDYQAVQRFFTQNLESSVQLFNEYHALIVRLAKEYCLKSKPKCAVCPLRTDLVRHD
ncbi:MAG: endonuclease III domain-containing protein [Candidatus Omnitrophica bacterium]|nr:endonuclease III domain-containing protein [Candidatus Omnitrophota bacterium]